jgi:class 3 adenylate cyclase
VLRYDRAAGVAFQLSDARADDPPYTAGYKDRLHNVSTKENPMNTFEDLSDGQKIDLLVGFYDINRFTAISKTQTPETVVSLLKGVGQITTEHIPASGGLIVKYIGDACLFAYPDELVDQAMRTLLELKTELERFFEEKGFGNTLTFSLHFGEVVALKIPPFDTWDIGGHAINIVWSLDRGPYRGQFVITPQVFRKLAPATRKLFHKHTPPIVYLSERSTKDSAS